MSRLHYGVVLSESAYSRFGHQLTHARTFVFNRFDDKARERLWFMLSKNESYVVCRSPRGDSVGELLPFIQSGLLLDLRSLPRIDSPSSLHDYIMMRIQSKREYIKCCHKIRNTLADQIDVSFRWNGAELESITHPSLVMKASYFTGLNDLGRFWDVNGRLNMHIAYKSSEQWIRNAFAEASGMEIGQAKLYSLMFGMAMKRDIIYIGSAPGTGWQACLRTLGYGNKIYSFDPLPLDTTHGSSENIIHIQKMINGPSDIWTEIPPGAYDLIWDVRGDTSSNYTDSANVVSIVESEIQILYSILECPHTSKNLRRINIKIKWDMINRYRLPDHARIFFLPFCWRDDRPINELRAVFLLRPSDPLIHRVFDYHVMRDSVINDRVDDLALFYNTLFMRLDPLCFMTNINTDVQLDVDLFCINWNDNTKIQRYFTNLKSNNINILSSYFSRGSLREGEHEIDEVMLLNSDMQIFDSRLFIPAKLENLYFFTDCGSLRWYKYELITAESYVIMDEEVRLRQCGLYDNYDSCRDEVCRSKGYTFLKFPNVSSLCDNIVSPSGHALRMVTAHLCGRVSLAMFILKIIYSFYKVRYNWVDYHPTRVVDRLFGIRLNLIDGYGERLIDKLWHSYVEWSTGIECGYLLMSRTPNIDMITYLSSKITAKTKLGIEISTYYSDRGVDYLLFLRKREQHRPPSDGNFTQLCDEFVDFPCDVKDYLLQFRITLPEWQTLVISLRVDKIVLELCILRSMYEVLSSHGRDEIFNDLFTLKTILAIAKGRFGHDSEEGIQSCDVVLWKYPLFLGSHIRRDPIACHQLNLVSSMTRFVWHSLCNNWITNMKYRRIVRSEELRNLTIPELPLDLQDSFVNILNSLLPDGMLFSIDEVKNVYSRLTSLRV